MKDIHSGLRINQAIQTNCDMHTKMGTTYALEAAVALGLGTRLPKIGTADSSIILILKICP